jgi:predicted metal-dependent phosphoesterase TrpH
VLIDLHVHSSHTQGIPFSLADLVARAKERKLDGFCLTDVNTLAGAGEAKRLGSEAEITVLAGFEARTDHGHYLVFVPDPDELPEISSWLRFDEKSRIVFSSLIDSVQSRQGVLVAAHPYDRAIDESPCDRLIKLEGIAAIEVLSGGRKTMADELAEEFAAGFGLPGIGGSNCHDDLEAMGKSATLTIDPVENEADLIERIRSGDVWPVSIGKLELPPRRARDSRSPGRSSRDTRGPSPRPRRDSRGPRHSRPRPKKS